MTSNMTWEDLEASKRVMSETVLPNSLIIPIAVLSVIVNCITIVVICTSKKLRTKCFALLAANSVADFCIGASYLATASVRVYRHYAGNGEVTSMWTCCQELSFTIFAQVLSLGMNTALVTERLLATFCPIRYKQWSYKQVTVPLILAAILFALVQLIVHLQNSWVGREKLLKACGIEDTVFPTTLSVLTGVQMSLSGVVVMLHGVLAYGVRKQKKKFEAASTRSNATIQREVMKMEADMKFMKAITGIVITHIFVIVARFTVFILHACQNDMGGILANRYSGQVVVLGSAVDFFLLLLMSSQFRAETRSLFRIGSATVSSLQPSAFT